MRSLVKQTLGVSAGWTYSPSRGHLPPRAHAGGHFSKGCAPREGHERDFLTAKEKGTNDVSLGGELRIEIAPQLFLCTLPDER
jgi:hypothetical protein